ncbi:hypothetical protein [Salinactinospora qingdaonensis]|uniref:MinD-like ATPase involved in chromosome partitioning or flagellar assembly n=1 Tax=Salinactinospora qingdaonensis TaxID=702744 RepID=A0ABP7FE53_9ACTN
MLVCMVTAKGAPGATTAALAMAMTWPHPVLMVEGDPAGGDLRSGFLQGADAGRRNLLQLAKTARYGLTAVDIARQCLSLDATEATRLVLPGLPEPFLGASLDTLWSPLLEAASRFWVRDPIWTKRVDLLVDCGRLDHPHLPWRLIEVADLVVLVFRATLPSITAARSRAEHLRSRLEEATGHSDALVGLMIEGSYRPWEVRETGMDVVATLPHDPIAARVLTERASAPRGFPRGRFMRAARTAAVALRGRGPEPATHSGDDAAGEAVTIDAHRRGEAPAHVGR